MSTTDLRNVTTRSTAMRAARAWAASDLCETARDARRDAVERGEDDDAAARDHYGAVAENPGSASDAWVNAGASRVLGLAPRWEEVFLREYDRATTHYARRALAAG